MEQNDNAGVENQVQKWHGDESEMTEMASTSHVVKETEMKEGMCVGERQTERHREREFARGLCDAYLLALDVWSLSIWTGFNV